MAEVVVTFVGGWTRDDGGSPGVVKEIDMPYDVPALLVA
jgi:hypothetical protein